MADLTLNSPLFEPGDWPSNSEAHLVRGLCKEYHGVGTGSASPVVHPKRPLNAFMLKRRPWIHDKVGSLDGTMKGFLRLHKRRGALRLDMWHNMRMRDIRRNQ
jgi:hypothetical protein